MLLSARMLNSVCDVNDYEFTSQFNFTSGDTITVSLMLVNLSKDKPAGRRYIPTTPATLQVIVNNVNPALNITKVATNPFASDRSIWSFTISPADGLVPGTYSLRLILNENGVDRFGSVQGALGVYSVTGAPKC